MKKFKSIVLSLLVTLFALTMTSCQDTQGIVWNVAAKAAGEGKITVEYPTGNPGLVVEGVATATATTTNDTTVLTLFASDGTFSVPNGGLLATDVLATPENYSKDEVREAQALVSEVGESAVKFHAEGDWKASVKGYAKLGVMYFVIDEEWPRTDTTTIAE